MTRSATFQLADLRIDGGVEQFVRVRREQGMSWRRIAIALRDEEQVDVTEVTLRSWFANEPWARTKRAQHRTTPPGRRGRARRRPLEQLDQRAE